MRTSTHLFRDAYEHADTHGSNPDLLHRSVHLFILLPLHMTHRVIFVRFAMPYQANLAALAARSTIKFTIV